MRIAVGGDNFEDAVVQLEDRNIESAAAEIVNGDDAVLLLVETVGERSGCGLVYQPQNFKARDASRVFSSLTLRIVEIRWYGNDGFCYRCSEKTLGIALELAQDKSRNLRRSKCLSAELNPQYLARLQIFCQA